MRAKYALTQSVDEFTDRISSSIIMMVRYRRKYLRYLW